MPDATRPYIGGQAVIEGVMMRAPKSLSVAVRRPDGTIAVREGPLRAKLLTGPYSKVPGLRGVLMLFESLSLGYGALQFSAQQQMSVDEQKNSKEAGGAVGLSVALAIGMFILLPQGLTSGLSKLLGTQWDLTSPMFHLVTGGFKLLVFTVYLSLISMVAEVRRVFQYHGAEHKTIFAYEAGKALTLENVRAESRLHPRCGTTFLVVVIAVSIVLGASSAPVLLPNAKGVSGWVLTFLLRLALLPFVAAISYELQRISARYCTTGPLRVLLYPGFLFQKITTREPDDSQLEIAIAAMELARVRDQLSVVSDGQPDLTTPDQLHVFDNFALMGDAIDHMTLPRAAE
jgi:uncharacterized protein YqhQ